MFRQLRPGFPPRWPGRPAILAAAAVSLTLGSVLGAAVAGAALAQAGQARTTGGPVQIEADSVDIRPQENLVLLTGNAVVIQDGTAIRSNTLRLVYRGAPGSPNGELDKVFADSEVFYITPEERVRGDSAVYDRSINQITIRGRVVVTQGQSVVQGSELVVNTVTRASRMRGADGRVRAVFFQQPGTAAPRGN
jgi:lipopolysaccharide export system protein LptA